MSELLIPFGIHRDTGLIVEPEDTVSGRACDCLCPGCHAPVLCRHSKVKRFHFAHDSRHELARPDEECPLNSAVSIAMMARNIAARLAGKTLKTAPYSVFHKHSCCFDRDEVFVANSVQAQIGAVSEDSGKFDIRIEVGNYPVFIDLVYKGKDPPALDEKTLQEMKAGVIAIDCDSFSVSRLKSNLGLRFSDLVEEFLLRDGDRRWRFHPRTFQNLEVCKRRHKCSPKRAEEWGWHDSDLSNRHCDRERGAKEPEIERTLMYCKACKLGWVYSPGLSDFCPDCNEIEHSAKP